MSQGILHIVSAPSGTGKSSLIQAALKTHMLLNSTRLSVSYTTRNMRPGEIHGKHYYFIKRYEFKKMIDENNFLEYAKVFENYYGTSYNEINQILSKGFNVVLDIDWQGAKQIRNKIPNTKSIFILPPSQHELKTRLCKRGQDNKDVITHRLEKAIEEIGHYKEYDYLIINDDFNIALNDLKTIIHATRLSISSQTIRYSNLIGNLLNNLI
ncbi:guanylate kinase [Candidatus Pantoea edessiphila]|uniref:Guanylate kinase n=1 Tax=Candidatus Pantoea edessiphila TaxID=2044610 RepID=A0A2P5SZM4_9GAMM|nr:guanylate kinase [Candidatus Pantoea edessiphila]PPI87789.1 guanylate kinase [Candidatus Pantoea edessiphila]